MATRTLAGVFAREEDILSATDAARREGLKIADVYTPYAVHGLDRAMDLEPSKLPWVCFLLGLTGAGLKVWFEYLTSAVWWPINVGGKPSIGCSGRWLMLRRGPLRKISGRVPISTMSACLVMAQNGSQFPRSNQYTGACLRRYAHSACG